MLQGTKKNIAVQRCPSGSTTHHVRVQRISVHENRAEGHSAGHELPEDGFVAEGGVVARTADSGLIVLFRESVRIIAFAEQLRKIFATAGTFETSLRGIETDFVRTD